MKNVFVGIMLLIAFASGYSAYYFGKKAERSTKDLNEERYSRMIAEESLDKSRSKLASLQSELTRVQTEQRNKEKMLKDQNLTATELKAQVDQIAKDRLAAQNKIKDLEAKIQSLETQSAQQELLLKQAAESVQNNMLLAPEPVSQIAVPGST